MKNQEKIAQLDVEKRALMCCNRLSPEAGGKDEYENMHTGAAWRDSAQS